MFLEELKDKLKKTLNLDQAVFSYPPDAKLGDLSLACFDLAKTRGKKPAELAGELAAGLKKDEDLAAWFSDVKAVGPYLNFYISPIALVSVIREISAARDAYGRHKLGGGQKVMIEYSNGNTHKEYHVGHLRNIAYGDAVNRLLAANGYEAIPVSYINDFGIHIAKTIWNWRRNPNYADRPENKGYLLGKCYAEASQALASNPEYKEEISRIMTEIESRTGENYGLWQKTRQWSIDYFAVIYKELGVKFREIFYENEVIAAGLELVKKILADGVLKKSEGAIIADLEKYDLGVLPIIRSDGTALYPVADLALASEKFRRYDLAQSIYVVDVRQSLYFKQLFKVLELMGYKQPLTHLSYDFVTLPGGMMASRTGNVITYEELKNAVVDKLAAETKERHQDWTAARVQQTALTLAIATMKFEMLKVGAEKIITFNISEALKFEGYTACYLQYSYVRLKSIVRKAGFNLFPSRYQASDLSEAVEKRLLMKIARYPEAVAAAGEKYNPSELAKYLFELAQLSNDYYHGVVILKAPARIKKARLALVQAVAQTLKNGLGILGIEVLEEM